LIEKIYLFYLDYRIYDLFERERREREETESERERESARARERERERERDRKREREEPGVEGVGTVIGLSSSLPLLEVSLQLRSPGTTGAMALNSLSH
jgi:hypothetical protein